MTKSQDNTGWWVGGICVAIVLIFGVVIFFGTKSSPQTKYKKNDPTAPKAVFDKTTIGYGPLKNKTDPVTVDYRLSNSGKSDLEISRITTSCHCTTAQFIYKNTKSPSFAMTPISGWKGVIESNESALIEVTYDPTKMINDGKIERGIYLVTNDPSQEEIALTFTAENNL